MTDQSIQASSPRPPNGAPSGHARPADACPYPRPFPPGFSACPAFEAAAFVAMTTAHRPLRAVTSCRHLEIRQQPGADGHYYPACALGTAEQRVQAARGRGATPGGQHAGAQRAG